MNSQLKSLIKSDLLKCRLSVSLKTFVSAFIKDYSFRYTFYLRVLNSNASSFLKYLCKKNLANLSRKRLCFINPNIPIGAAFRLGHCFDVIIDAERIGNNVKVMQQVTIGRCVAGNRQGVPIIGDNIYIGAGAKIVGKVNIGNNVIIGANAVVTKDVPSNAVVGGVPAKIIRMNGDKEIHKWL